jgi:outer membrane lipoprotein SlyB
MQLRAGSFCALLLIVGCATRTEPAMPRAQAAQAAGLHGTILAMRPVPAQTQGPALRVLSSLGTPAAADNHVFEFIVRMASGTVIAVVQPQANNLRPGDQVSILHGTETRIEAPATD